MAKLKPCKCKCKGDHFAFFRDKWTDYNHKVQDMLQIGCLFCGAKGPFALTEEEAIDAWNKRSK